MLVILSNFLYNGVMEKFCIVTYGCQMNVHESEKLSGILLKMGLTETLKPTEADVIVFNTCCIRESAENKAKGNIGALKGYKKKNPNVIIAVGGCMPQQKGEAEKLIAKFPFIDIIFGTQNLFLFEKFLEERIKGKKHIIELEYNSPLPPENIEFNRDGKDNNAYVNITYGCNNFCTYCIVPYVRGRERSRKESDIINECKQILKEGRFKSITLLGQNVNSYGNDLNDGSNFSKLLKNVASLDGDFVVKFMTSHPKDLSDELIETIATTPKISHDIHLPCQSGSTKILEAMNRRYTREHYLEIVKKIRAKIKDANISTDLIVGFPGETEEDFAITVENLKKSGLTQIHTFPYSIREGTVGATRENQVDEKIRQIRSDVVKALSTLKHKDFIEKNIGKTHEILIEKHPDKKTGCLKGVTRNYLTVITDSKDESILNTLQLVKITHVENGKIFGILQNAG